MERFVAGAWTLDNLEPLSAWAEELRVIPGTTVTASRRMLLECDARLGRLTAPAPVIVVKPPAARKSARTHKKPQTEPAVPSASGAMLPFQPGQTYVNAVKVRVSCISSVSSS